MRIDASSLGEGEARLHIKAEGRRYWCMSVTQTCDWTP